MPDLKTTLHLQWIIANQLELDGMLPICVLLINRFRRAAAKLPLERSPNLGTFFAETVQCAATRTVNYSPSVRRDLLLRASAILKEAADRTENEIN